MAAISGAQAAIVFRLGKRFPRLGGYITHYERCSMKGSRICFGRIVLATALALSVGLLFSFPANAAKEAPLISKEELKADLGKAGLTIIDVRSPKDWAASDKKIKGAVREDSKATEDWSKKYAKDTDIVLY
jgi:hypothetical protein